MINKFYDFLLKVDKDFPTPLSERVNLIDYATKLASLATISAIIDKDDILGMVAMYCNDKQNGYAYIPLVAVVPEARGRKLSRALMIGAITMAKDNKFSTIGIHTENPIALSLYESIGFKIVKDGERKYLELKI